MPDDATRPASPSLADDDAKLIAILAELQRLQLARTDFYEFVKFVKPDLRPAVHQKKLARFVQNLYEGRATDAEGTPTKNACVLLPPRSGKSEYSSRKLIAWVIGNVEASGDTCQNIIVSSSESLARGDFGASIKATIQSEAYQRLYPRTQISEKSAAADEFRTINGSVVLTRPLGGQLIGFGASANGVLVLDDPVKSRVDCTPTTLAQIESYWDSVLVQRCFPGTVRLISMTPWSLQDIGHRVLRYKERGTPSFAKYAVPAISRDPVTGADVSWYPEEFSLDALRLRAREIGDLEWQSQYMQQPHNPAGAIWRQENFRYHANAADFETRSCYAYASVDLAYSEGNDHSAIGVFLVDPVGSIFLVEAWSQPVGMLRAFDKLALLCSKWYVRGITFEKDANWESNWNQYKRLCRERVQNVPRFFPLSTYSGGAGKVGKSAAILLLQEQGSVYFPPATTCPEWPELERMLLQWTGMDGERDDICDVLANIGRISSYFPGRSVDPYTGKINKQFGPDKTPYDISKPFGGQLRLGDVNDTGMNVIGPDQNRY